MSTRKGTLSAEMPAANKTTPVPRRDAEILRARGALAKQPKEEIYIPIDPLNPKDRVMYAAVDGHSYGIPKGKKVLVPRSIYVMLRLKGLI